MTHGQGASSGEEVELKLILQGDLAYGLLRAALDRLAVAEVAEQVNYYLDTAARTLHQHRTMVRVRVAAGRARVTCKSQPVLQDGIMRVGEREHTLAESSAAAWLSKPPHRCTMADLQALAWLEPHAPLSGVIAAETPLYVLGAMSNTRLTYHLPAGAVPWAVQGQEPIALTLELDHAQFGAAQIGAAQSGAAQSGAAQSGAAQTGAAQSGAAGTEGHRYELELEHPDAAAIQPSLFAWLDELGVAADPATDTKFAQMLRILDGEAVPSLKRRGETSSTPW